MKDIDLKNRIIVKPRIWVKLFLLFLVIFNIIYLTKEAKTVFDFIVYSCTLGGIITMFLFVFLWKLMFTDGGVVSLLGVIHNDKIIIQVGKITYLSVG